MTAPLRRALSPDAERRARLLLEEGMPATWVAEDLGVPSEYIYAVSTQIQDRAEHVLEWQRAWARLRRNPLLLDLHREFNPAHPKGQGRAA